MALNEAAHERRIRARALRMWRADGSPPGRRQDYLERARELQAIEDHPQAGLLPNPMTGHADEVPPVEPVEEAELMENLGEFPSQLTDQGDRPATPVARRKTPRGAAGR
jgi:hypothetical protein